MSECAIQLKELCLSLKQLSVETDVSQEMMWSPAREPGEAEHRRGSRHLGGQARSHLQLWATTCGAARLWE